LASENNSALFVFHPFVAIATAKSFDSQSPLTRAVVATPADYSEEQQDIIR